MLSWYLVYYVSYCRLPVARVMFILNALICVCVCVGFLCYEASESLLLLSTIMQLHYSARLMLFFPPNGLEIIVFYLHRIKGLIINSECIPQQTTRSLFNGVYGLIYSQEILRQQLNWICCEQIAMFNTFGLSNSGKAHTLSCQFIRYTKFKLMRPHTTGWHWVMLLELVVYCAIWMYCVLLTGVQSSFIYNFVPPIYINEGRLKYRDTSLNYSSTAPQTTSSKMIMTLNRHFP